MHKDPPPGLLERPVKVIVVYGLLTGFAAGVVCFGAWTLISGASSSKPPYQPPITERIK